MTAKFKSIGKIIDESENASNCTYFYGMDKGEVISFIKSVHDQTVTCRNLQVAENAIRSCNIVGDPNGYFWPMWFFEEIEEREDEN